jgi:predicted alpha/beta hydrolase
MQTDATHDAAPALSVESLTLVTDDAHALGATLFTPAAARRGDALGTVIVHSATAVPAGFYRRFAEHLAQHGMRVLTYDYRGIGRSRPASLRGFDARMSDWALRDAAAAHALVSSRFPGEPIATVGHSFGGQLIGLLDAASDVRGTLLVCSQLGFLGHWPARDRLRLTVIWRLLVPLFTRTLGYLPGWSGIGEDLPLGVAREWASWCTHPEYLMSAYPAARERYAGFDKPLLVYSTTDDAIAPERAVSALLDLFTGAQVEHHRIAPASFDGAPIGHFGFFKPRFSDTLWSEATRFFQRAFGAPGAAIGDAA